MRTTVPPSAVRSPSAVRPPTIALLRAQVGHTVTELWRARVVLIFTVALPVVWLVVIGIVAGNATLDGADGVRVMQFVTPIALAMGVLYAAFPTVAISLTQARELGTLTRVRGTPLPVWVFLAGRIAGAAAFALAAVAVVMVLAVVAYDVQVVWSTVPATVATLVAATTCFAAMGVAFSVLSPSAAVAQAGSIASAVVLTFVSGLFTIGGPMPGWLDAVGDLLPLKPVTEALQAQLNPFHPGAGWDAGSVVVVAAWTTLACLVALRWFGERWAPAVPRSPAPAPDAAPESPRRQLATATARRSGAGGLVADQVGAALRSTWRDPGAVFFALVMPVGLYALMVFMQGAELEIRPGVRFADFFAAGMVTWGTAVTAFMNLPEAVASARDRKVLKRLRGTPLRPWQYLVGRTLAGIVVVLAIAAAVLVTAWLSFDVRPTPAGLVLGLGILALGTLSLAAAGFVLAAFLRDARAVGAVALVVLLPLAFFSDVFIGGGPSWMGRVGDLFPLKHLQNGLAEAWDPSGASIGWVHVAVLAGWAVVAGLVALRRFRWDVADPTDATARPAAPISAAPRAGRTGRGARRR